MQEVQRKRAALIGLRARVPLVLRLIAAAAFVAVLAYAGISLYRNKSKSNFVLHNGRPELSCQVVSTVEGYERRVTDGDRLTLLVTAARDITYSDNHHELEDVKLESYRAADAKPNRVTAARAIYLPAAAGTEQGTITFTGNVKMESDNGLIANSETVVYDTQAELATTTDPITFSRENISGQAVGARVDSKNERLELGREVQITVDPKSAPNGSPGADARSQPLIVRSGQATFDQRSHRLEFSGGATAEQATDIMSGERMTAWISSQKKVEKIEVRQNAYLRTMSEGRAAEVHAVEMGFMLGPNQQLQHATASKDVTARSLNADSEMQLTGAAGLEVVFVNQQDKSVLKEMKASGGRSVLTLAAPLSRKGDPKAANKRLTADSIKMYWRERGRDLERAEASGNSELIVEPVNPSPTADKQTLTAPNFVCDFYDTGNLAKSFAATGNAKVVLEPMQPAPNRFVRTITAQKMTANFVREHQGLERYDAVGDAKFTEEDRNGVAANATYTAADETVRLRGGDPTVWDSRARSKALEWDSDTKNKISYGRGKVSTTYYNQEQTGGATPFTKVKSPVFITAERVEFNHDDKVAVYSGNSRAWQDDNFVKSERLTLRGGSPGSGSMLAETRVQSALYQVRKRDARGAAVPAFASADRMTYSEKDRLLHYEGNADIRQGTDRITGNSADVFMSPETNDVQRTVAQQNVVMTQPGRRGTGDWAQYTVADETFVLKGRPAHVEDAEQGTTDGQTLTVYMRENRIVADNGAGSSTPGRGRSTHKVSKP